MTQTPKPITHIHILHHRTGELLTTFDNTPNRVFTNAVHKQDYGGQNRFDFDVPAHQDAVRHLQGKFRVLIPSETGDSWQEFIAFQPEADELNYYISAVGSETHHDQDKIIEPAVHTGKTLAEYANIAESKWFKPGRIDFVQERSITVDKHCGAFEYLQLVAEEFDVILQYRVEVGAHGVVGRYYDMIQRPSVRSNVLFGPETGLLSLRKSINAKGIVTALYCVGPEREDGTQLKLTVTSREALDEWGWQGDHLTGVYQAKGSNADMTADELRAEGQAALDRSIAALFEYEADAQVIAGTPQARNARLGAKVDVVHRAFNPPIFAEARIIGVERRIDDPSIKKYRIGEIAEQSEAEVMATFKQLQRLYGVKMIRSELAPDGQPRTLWIPTTADLNVPHVFNATTQEWEKTAPTDAAEIGGLVVGQQYNGVAITPEDGLVVTRTDDLARTTVNATEGISIETRADSSAAYAPVFFVNTEGQLTVAALIRGSQIVLGGENDQDGELTVLDQYGAPVAEIKAGYGGFPELNVGKLNAPNKVEYADYSLEPLTLYVATTAPYAGDPPPSDSNDGLCWSTALQTLGEALRRLPRQFDGEVTLVVAHSQRYFEDVIVSGFGGGGKLTIKNSLTYNNATLEGSMRFVNNSVRVELDRVNIDSTDSYAGLFVQNTHGVTRSLRINGATGSTSFGVNVNAGGMFEFYSTRVENVNIGFRASYGGVAYVNDGLGTCATFGVQGFGGGLVAGAGTAPTGGTSNEAETEGGRVTGTWSFPTPDAPPTPTVKTQKNSWSATSDSGSYRTDYGAWDVYASANQVTQGAYSGHGPFVGSWFFGSAPSNAVSGKSIKSIRVYIERDRGGSSASMSARLRPHTSTSRPSGNVSVQTPSHTAGFRVGEGRWITLPSSFHAGFASGSYKGVSINGSAYMKFKKAAKLEITYE